jgi:RimJ/RimL family protein N-acetyltransferase
MIRLAEEQDVEAILQIKREVTTNTSTTKYSWNFPNELYVDVSQEKKEMMQSQDKGNLYIVYEQNNCVVGVLIFKRLDYERLNHTGYMGIYIRETFTNQGAGTQLIEYLLNWAKNQRNLEKICLGVTSINELAIKVYRRLGFVEEGRQRKQLKFEDGTYGDEILMAYYL